jgi:hypothetical protein
MGRFRVSQVLRKARKIHKPDTDRRERTVFKETLNEPER